MLDGVNVCLFIVLTSSNAQTTHSSSELLASLFAPCNDVQATSPGTVIVRKFNL